MYHKKFFNLMMADNLNIFFEVPQSILKPGKKAIQ
jgi:hypothetical protein